MTTKSGDRTGKKVVVIVKKVSDGHGHHGGSWKVAYADFVTAMMAFFLVMWILGMDQDMRKAVQGYFSNPAGVRKGGGAGKSPISVGSAPISVHQPEVISLPRRFEERELQAMADELKAKAAALGLAESGASVEVVTTHDGIRVDVSEDSAGDALFTLGSARMTPAMKRVLLLIGARLKALSNTLVIEGHTDRFAYASGGGGGYGNWELSAERANAARRELELGGVAPERIVGVRGMADRELRFPARPFDAHNRRISILLLDAPAPAAPAESVATTAPPPAAGAAARVRPPER